MFTYLSIDGYMTRADGDIDWILEFKNPNQTDYGFKAFFNSVNSVIMNHNHYLMLLGYDLCESALSKHTIMVNTELNYEIPGDYDIEYVVAGVNDYGKAIDFLKKYKAENEGDLCLLGDHRLIHALLENGLVDEITVTVLPVSLGAGARLFPTGFKKSDWRISDHKDYQNGVVQMKYRAVEPS